MRLYRLFITYRLTIIVVCIALFTAAVVTPQLRENGLYKAMRTETIEGISVQKSTENNGTDFTFKVLAKPDGTFRMTGDLSCDVQTKDIGTAHFTATFSQVQRQLFAKITAPTFASASHPEMDLQSYKEQRHVVTDKWLEITADDPLAGTFANDNILFAMGDAWSPDHSRDGIIAELKGDKVLTISDAEQGTYDGQPATLYAVVVDRSAYGRFMDDIDYSLSNKQAILDGMFNGMDSQEMDVIVNNASGKIVSEKTDVTNYCKTFADMLSIPNVVNQTVSVRAESTTEPGDDLPAALIPADYLSADQLQQQMVMARQSALLDNRRRF